MFHPGLELTSPIERRRAPRQTLVAEARLRPVRVGGPMAKAFVRDISSTGVGLHVAKPLQIGHSFLVGVAAGPLRWTSRVRVVSCRENSRHLYDVGAEFISKARNWQVESPQTLAA